MGTIFTERTTQATERKTEGSKMTRETGGILSFVTAEQWAWIEEKCSPNG